MSSILALLFAAHVALAGTTTTVAGLEARLRELNRSVAEPILVGAAGGEAEKILDRMERNGPLPVRVVRVPTVGDAGVEMERALGSAGLRCGLRVTMAAGSNLAIETFGDCRSAAEAAVASELPPVPPAAPAAPPPSPAPVAAVPAPSVEAPSGPGLDRGDLLYVGRAWAKAPDPTVALLESTILGFGMGHFYARRPKEGAVHLGLQVVGSALSGLGYGIYADASVFDDNRRQKLAWGEGLMIAGGALFSTDRVVDIYRAPLSARDERVRLMGGR
ncbi:MAG: hypothetical protein ABIO70_01365 [Pseudomonadota bacterium]